MPSGRPFAHMNNTVWAGGGSTYLASYNVLQVRKGGRALCTHDW